MHLTEQAEQTTVNPVANEASLAAEIKITPEMVAAGVLALDRYGAHYVDEELVSAVYTAMAHYALGHIGAPPS